MAALTSQVTIDVEPRVLTAREKQAVVLTVRNAGPTVVSDLVLSTRGGLAISVVPKARSRERLAPHEAWVVTLEMQPSREAASLILPVTLHWQTPERGSDRAETEIAFRVAPPGPKPAPGAFHALIVGAGLYDDPRLPDFPAAPRDARALAAALTETGATCYLREHVTLLVGKEATASRLRGEFMELAVRAQAGDTLFLFISCHGCRSLRDPGGYAYLCLRDAIVDALPATAMADAELAALLARVPARRALIVLDGGHAPGTARLKTLGGYQVWRSGLPDTALRQLAAGEGRILISAAQADQVARPRSEGDLSLFGHHLVAALRGGAAGRTGGAISALGVHTYVDHAVRRETEAQTPVLAVSDAALDFPIAGVGRPA